jgi:hypothetical protein
MAGVDHRAGIDPQLTPLEVLANATAQSNAADAKEVPELTAS